MWHVGLLVHASFWQVSPVQQSSGPVQAAPASWQVAVSVQISSSHVRPVQQSA